MEDESKNVLLIYYKRKDGVPLTQEEQIAWDNYRIRYPEPDPSKFDEVKLRQLIRMQKSMLSWEDFKKKHNIKFP